MAGKETEVSRPIESEDIIREILLQLHRKSLARFKSISKQWLGVISSASFIQDYDTKNLPRLYCFCNCRNLEFSDKDHPIINLSLPSLDNTSSVVEFHNFPGRSTSIVHSSNGLILYHTIDENEKLKSFYFLRNPVTDQYFPIPVPPPGLRLWIRTERVPRAGLGLGDATGFAFDHSSNPPHLIVITVFKMHVNVLRAISYSSYTRRWACKDHELPFPYQLDPGKLKDYFQLHGPSTFLNGKLHWVSYWSRIFAYDVKEAKFSIMEGPVNEHIFYQKATYPGGVYLGQSRQRLIYIQFNFDSVFGCIVSLWTLENYSNCKWTRGYQIKMENIPAHPKSNWPALATDLLDNKVLYLSLGNKLYSYHVDKELFYCHTPDAFEDMYLDTLRRFGLFRPWFVYSLYELPKSPPFISPEHYFSALFGAVPFMGWHDFNNMLKSDAMPDSRPRQS